MVNQAPNLSESPPTLHALHPEESVKVRPTNFGATVALNYFLQIVSRVMVMFNCGLSHPKFPLLRHEAYSMAHKVNPPARLARVGDRVVRPRMLYMSVERVQTRRPLL